MAFKRKQQLLAFGLVVFLLTVANYFLNWGAFGAYEKLAMAVTGVGLAAALHLTGATVAQVERNIE